MEKCADKAAYIAAIKLSKELDIANKLSGILDEAVSDKDQFRRYLIKEKGSDGTTVTEEQIFNKIDMKSLGSAIKALESLEQIKSVMYGIVSPLDERKLQLEEAKRMEKQKEESGESGVIILPDIKEEKS